MKRKTGSHVVIEKLPTENRDRSPAPTTRPCQILEIRGIVRRGPNISRSASPKDSSRRGFGTDPPSRRTANHPRPRRPTSPAWDEILLQHSSPSSLHSSDADSIQNDTDSDSNSVVIVTNQGGGSRSQPRTTRCPFFARDPHGYVRCANVSLSPDHTLMDHLFQRHLQLPVCYRCATKFESAAQLDEHLVLGGCELVPKPLPTFEGVGEGTFYELERLISSWGRRVPRLSDEEKYAKAWGLLFPGESFQAAMSGTRDRRKRARAR